MCWSAGCVPWVQEFAEFGWVLDEVNVQLAFIAEDVARTAATARDVADNQQQTLVELAMLRQEARNAIGSRAGRPDAAVLAGPSADEERAAALDAAAVPVSADCPYLGLAAFQPEDAGRFFGREQLTAELVTRAGEQLARPGLLMVLGPSGSGKSSLLRAGLAARGRRRGASRARVLGLAEGPDDAGPAPADGAGCPDRVAGRSPGRGAGGGPAHRSHQDYRSDPPGHAHPYPAPDQHARPDPGARSAAGRSGR